MRGHARIAGVLFVCLCITQLTYGLDDASKKMLAGEDDPTFDAVSKLYPVMKNPREAVGVADHPLEIGVNRLGQIDLSPTEAPVASIEIDDPPTPFGSNDSLIERRLLDGYIPVVTLKTVHGRTRLEETIFGWSEGMKPEKDLIAFVRVRAIAREGSKPPTRVSLIQRDGKRIGFDMVATSASTSEACVTFTFPDPASARAVGGEEFEQKLVLVASAWRELIKPGARFDLPDARVMEAYRAWIAYSMLDCDAKDGQLEPHDGAGFYEMAYGISAAVHSVALDQYGLHDRAARVQAMLLHAQQPDGLYTSNFGLPDQGSFLVALHRHYQMTGDAEFLKKASPNIIRAGEWILKQRAAAPKDGLTRGMIKFRPYCDFPEPVYGYFGDTWCCVGLEAASDALRAAGDTGNADRFAAEAKRYREDLLASMDAAAFVDGDRKLLPMEPATHRLLKDNGNRGGDYYGLAASSLLENEFLAAHDPRAKLIVDALEQRGGLIAGVCEFQKGIDHAYTTGYLLNRLQVNDPRKVLLGFWSMLAFGMTHDTYSPVEVTMIATGENQLTLPHLYSCTEQLRLLREMLLREDGETLRIGDAIPRAWLEKGKHVTVTDAPTRFGPVSFTIEAKDDETMNVHIAPPTRTPPAKIRIRLRGPRRREIVDVQPGGGAINGETIELTNVATPLHLTVRFGTKITPRSP